MRVLKRRITGILLCLLLLLPLSASAAAKWNPSSEREARDKSLSLFLYCAFHAEYTYPGDQELLSRWEKPIAIWLGGSPTAADRDFVDTFLHDLRDRVPHLPGIYRVREDSKANIRMWFIPSHSMRWYDEEYVDGNLGFFSYDMDSQYRITSARVLICSDDTTQTTRNHLIMEELVGALGLPGDHYEYKDSILYEPWTTVQELSDVDWRMLNYLYDPRLSPGITNKKARYLLQNPV